MGETSRRKVDVQDLISYSNDLVQVLKDGKDFNCLKQCLEQSKSLQSQCDKDFDQVQRAVQDYERKIQACREKTSAAESEAVTDAELELLQKELEDEQQREQVLRQELRVIVNEINDLERRRISVEERRQALKKLEQDDLRAQMKLSMYASVTNIIPNLDNPSIISGHIVERDKKVVEKFEFDPAKQIDFATCNNIWKMISS